MDAKLQLSAEESRLMADPAWILTKNSVMGKVVGMMAGLAEDYKLLWAAAGDRPGVGSGHRDAIEPGNAKISRGENYQGLPWVILDYPRIFGREEVLAIRTMFWWGHTFSVTLHLKGHYRERYLPAIERHRERLSAAGFHAGVSADEWRHEHLPDNYARLETVGHIGEGKGFVKLSAAVGLDRWTEAPRLLTEQFELLSGVLRDE